MGELNSYVHSLKVCNSALRLAKGILSINDNDFWAKKPTRKFTSPICSQHTRESSQRTRRGRIQPCRVLGLGAQLRLWQLVSRQAGKQGGEGISYKAWPPFVQTEVFDVSTEFCQEGRRVPCWDLIHGELVSRTRDTHGLFSSTFRPLHRSWVLFLDFHISTRVCEISSDVTRDRPGLPAHCKI